MKIGYFVTLFPYRESFEDPAFPLRYPIGGAELWAYYLAREMAKFGHEITVFTTSVDSKTVIEKQNGINIFRYGTDIKIEKAFFSRGLFFDSVKQDVDIVHLHFTIPPGDMAGLNYSRVKKKPLVVHYHGDQGANYGTIIRRAGLGLFNLFVVPRILSTARTIISNSTYYTSQSRYISKYKDKIVTIPPGIDAGEITVSYSKKECREKLGLSVNSSIILFVGQLVNYKSPDLLLLALPKVMRAAPDASLVFVGDGPQRQELEAMVMQLGLSGRVIFAGRVYNEQKALYYNAADVFVLPSTGKTESFGMVLMEAAVAGLPLVVSSLDAFRAFVTDRSNGLITRTGDVDSLGDAISLLLTDHNMRLRIGANARASVEGYSWENIARKVETVYNNILPGC